MQVTRVRLLQYTLMWQRAERAAWGSFRAFRALVLYQSKNYLSNFLWKNCIQIPFVIDHIIVLINELISTKKQKNDPQVKEIIMFSIGNKIEQA